MRCTKARSPEALAAFAKEQGGALTVKTWPATSPSGSRRFRATTGATRCTKFRPTARHCRADRAGHSGKFDLASLPVDSTASQHLQIEAMKLAFADVYRYVSERSTMEVTTEQMLTTPTWPRARASSTCAGRRTWRGNPVKGGTIYLTAADENGMMVSFIQSNYMGFGSGCPRPSASACKPGLWFQPDAASPNNVVAPGKAALPPPSSSGLPDQGRPAGDELRRDGRQTCNRRGHMQTLVRMLTIARACRPRAMRHAGASTRA